MKLKALFLLCAFLTDPVCPTKPRNVYKTTHLSATQVGITCLNGADPTGTKLGDLLVISCGKP
jgi:hypothetical protein